LYAKEELFVVVVVAVVVGCFSRKFLFRSTVVLKARRSAGAVIVCCRIWQLDRSSQLAVSSQQRDPTVALLSKPAC
jgi:hypothetical protein